MRRGTEVRGLAAQIPQRRFDAGEADDGDALMAEEIQFQNAPAEMLPPSSGSRPTTSGS